MSEIPEDIMETAFRLTESAWQQKHPELAGKVAAALLAERMAARERCAKIAKPYAAAIRNQDKP